jgi:RNA polymerase sigma factor (sigma-70 family)
MAAEYMPIQEHSAGWPAGLAELRDRHREELLERSRPMASSLLGLLGAMTDEQATSELFADDAAPPMESWETTAEEDPLADDEEEMNRLESSIAWHQMIEHLHPRLQRVIELRFYRGLSRREVARRLGLSARQVSYLQRCALRQLRTEAMTA